MTFGLGVGPLCPLGGSKTLPLTLILIFFFSTLLPFLSAIVALI